MDGDGLKEFQNNLKKVSSFANPILITAMEKAQVIVCNEAKRDHIFVGNAKGAHNPEGHPSGRYYTHSGKLTNSIRPGKVLSGPENITGEVKAGDNSTTQYALYVEEMGYSYLATALDAKQDEIMQLFADAVKEVLK